MRRFVNGFLSIAFVFMVGAACVQSVPPATQPASPADKGSVPGQVSAEWQKKWDQTLAAAKKEGTLMIYGEVNPTLKDELTRGFESKYGITLEFAIGKANEIATKWTREKSAGLSLVDVFHSSPSLGISTMIPQGGWGSLEPYLILPEVTDPRAWPEGKVPFLDKGKTMIPLNGAYTSYVAVNTELVKEGQLKSYRDLLKPEWKGKIVFFDPTIFSASTGWTTFMMTDVFGLEGGKAYLREFAANEPVIIRDPRLQVEWVARGKNPIGVGVGHAIVSEFQAPGAPIKIQRFVEGGSINPGSGAVEVATNPVHPNAAAIYINWLLTREGQAAAARGMASPPLRLGVTVEGIDPSKQAQPGEKFFLTTEDFFKTQLMAVEFSKEAFKKQLGK